MTLAAVFVGLVFVYSLVSRRLETTVLTAPILFTIAGILAFDFMPERARAPGRLGLFLALAELGLVLLLFTDASRTDLRLLNRIRNLPARLLSVGMLLTILLGALGAALLLRNLSWWEAGILAAILAPTDAGLGQVIVNSPRVPERIRQALNMEAGLNDGLSVPFLMFFIALAAKGAEPNGASLLQFIVEQLGYGTLVGLGVGLAGGWLLNLAHRNDWMAESTEQLGVVALPLFCLLMSDAVGASMFIAAFVGGLAVQFPFKQAGRHSVEFTEEWGQVLNLSVFFLFGVLVARDFHAFNLALLAYAVLSLTLVRLLPVAVALIRTGLSGSTVLFMGWFGPRGLASIVLGLVYLEQELHQPGEATIRLAVTLTVLLSIFAHGLSALPGIHLYATRVAALAPAAAELRGTATATGRATATSGNPANP
jgi:NhaP-type Na+/H+ or K+/H+ antiporter